MARRLRIQYPGAIYHVMARGNGRQDIVADDADRGRLMTCLERAVARSGWVLYAFAFLTNHLHLVLKTPRPNLARGMQQFLSAYANGWSRRHDNCGHLFQGRYRTELVEDETYLWVLTPTCTSTRCGPVWLQGRMPGGGQAVPAISAVATVLTGWPTTSCWRRGPVSLAGPMPRRRTVVSSPRV